MYARLAVFCLLLGGAMLCVAQEQSLGEVARQNKMDGRVKATRVITNDNLPHASPSEAMNGAVVRVKQPGDDQVSTSGAAKPSGSSTTLANPGDAQKRLDELKATEEAQQRAVKKFEEELKDDSISLERRELFEEGLRNAKDLLEQASTERSKIEQSVSAPTSGAAKAPAPKAESEKAGDAAVEKDASPANTESNSSEPKSDTPTAEQSAPAEPK